MTFTIQVEIMISLRRFEGKRKFNLSIPEKMTASQLLKKLNFNEVDQKYLIVIVNNKQVKHSYILQENDINIIISPKSHKTLDEINL